MNITELKVGDFGAWHELSLTNLSRGVTVFYGPNEAGKTTLLNLIRTILYGFSDKRCERYLPPAFGDRAGGTLTIDGLHQKRPRAIPHIRNRHRLPLVDLASVDRELPFRPYRHEP